MRKEKTQTLDCGRNSIVTLALYPSVVAVEEDYPDSHILFVLLSSPYQVRKGTIMLQQQKSRKIVYRHIIPLQNEFCALFTIKG